MTEQPVIQRPVTRWPVIQRPVTRRMAAAVGCGLAVVLCLPALLLRIPAEQQPGTIEVAVAGSAISAATAMGGLDGSATLARLRTSGVGAIVVGMRSVQSFRAGGDVVSVSSRSPAARRLPPTRTSGPTQVLRCRPGDPGQVCARIAAAARARYGPDQVSAVGLRPLRAGALSRAGTTSSRDAGTMPYVRVAGVRMLDYMAVGYDLGRLRTIVASRLRVVLALPAGVPSGRAWLEAEVDRAVAATGARTVLAIGPLPFGSRAGDRAAFAGFLVARHLDLALPDLTLLPGAEEYGGRLAGRVVRSHVMPVGPANTSTDGARHTLVVRSHRAEKERGVRLLFLRQLSKDQTSKATLDVLAGLVPALTSNLPAGLHVGPPAAMSAVKPGILTDAGSVLGALLVLASAGWFAATMPVRRPQDPNRRPQNPDPQNPDREHPDPQHPDRGSRTSPLRSRERPWRTLARTTLMTVVSARAAGVSVGAAAVVGAGALATGWPILWQVLALVVAIAGASVAVLVAVAPASTNGIVASRGRHVISSYALSAGCALATGLVVAALGSRSEFLVGLAPFVGVKLLLLAPPVIIALATGTGAAPSVGGELKGLWSSHRLACVLAGIVLLASATYYLVRSGNYGAAPRFELWLRDALDEAMYVRPRFKEALLGFPALAVALACRQPQLLHRALAVVAAIGTSSLVDSFAHFHTPVLVSVLRSVYAVLIGLVVGSAAVFVVRLLERRAQLDQHATPAAADHDRVAARW